MRVWSNRGYGETRRTRNHMKPVPNDKRLAILITGDEYHDLKCFNVDMVEAFGWRVRERVQSAR